MSNSNPKTYIGIDHGETNIGVALGRNGMVTPLRIIDGTNEHHAAQTIARIGIENKADKFILGIALTVDDKETYQSKQARKFGKLLKIISKRPVEYYEEKFTSQEAHKIAVDMGIPTKQRITNDDIAAAIILKRYLSDIKED